MDFFSCLALLVPTQKDLVSSRSVNKRKSLINPVVEIHDFFRIDFFVFSKSFFEVVCYRFFQSVKQPCLNSLLLLVVRLAVYLFFLLQIIELKSFAYFMVNISF